MSFSAIDFLISIPVAAAVIGAIVLFYKKTDREATPMGCLIGCIIIFWLVLCCVGGISKRQQAKEDSNLVEVTYVASGKVVKMPKDEFEGNDTIYRRHKSVYKNDTGKDLVKYSVKYTKDGNDSPKPVGLLIRPGDYFLWSNSENSRMFQSPPSSTNVYHRSSYGKNHKLDYTYLEFLDYAESVATEMDIVGYETDSKKSN